MYRFLLVFAGLLLLSIVLFIVSQGGSGSAVADPANYDASLDRESLIASIKKVGPAEAYKRFVEENNEAPFEIQHVRAHVIGESLFETEGIEGIAICDSSFGFGCFHGLFTIGFASQGRTFVQEADQLCVRRYGTLGTGCQHGIGHGIVEYVGHQNLPQALELCEETSQPTPLLGCTSGVFMEHNTPFTILPGVEKLEPFPFVQDKPYAACEEVSEKYKESCYYELGGWWEVVLQGDKSKMGELCSEVLRENLRDACALGLGNIIGPTSGYSIASSSDTCSQTPENVRTMCSAGVAWSMYSNPEHREKAIQMCEILQDEERNTCEKTYNLAHPKD